MSCFSASRRRHNRHPVGLLRLGLVLGVFLTMSLVPTLASAQAPGLVPIQGQLHDADGTPVDGTLDVAFTLYSDAAGTMVVWSDTISVDFDQGAFTAYLGSGNGLNLALFRDNAVYLGIAVDGDPELPVFEVASVPYAGYAAHAGSAEAVSSSGQTQIYNGFLSTLGDPAPDNTLNHTRYTDQEAVGAMGMEGPTNTLNHARYTDGEAVTAMGTKADTNALHHDRYTDGEAASAAVASGDVVTTSGDSTITGSLTVTGTVDGTLAAANLPPGGRLCPLDHYMSMGYCLPKVPYTDKTTCTNGTLRNGVCYSWPSPTCQFLNLDNARSACSAISGRLCTVAELDRLDGTGCGQDGARAWANLGLTYDDNNMFGLCIRAQDSYVNRAGGSATGGGNDDIAACTPVHYASPSARSQVDGYVMCCFD